MHKPVSGSRLFIQSFIKLIEELLILVDGRRDVHAGHDVERFQFGRRRHRVHEFLEVPPLMGRRKIGIHQPGFGGLRDMATVEDLGEWPAGLARMLTAITPPARPRLVVSAVS